MIAQYNQSNFFLLASESYKNDANILYNELKAAVLEKLSQLKKGRAPCNTNFKEISDQMNKIMELQSEYIRTEKDRNELIQKLRETVVKQNATCEEMLK